MAETSFASSFLAASSNFEEAVLYSRTSDSLTASVIRACTLVISLRRSNNPGREVEFTEKRRKAPPFRAGDIKRDFAFIRDKHQCVSGGVQIKTATGYVQASTFTSEHPTT